MNGRRDGSPERLGPLVEGLLRSRGLSEGVERAAVIADWAGLVGPQIARVANPVGFDRETLFVEVSSSAWLMELRLLERRILGELNAARRRGKFERIVFRLAGGS
ncbi:MAG: DUF721 domain-containing protein [Gemmatimonadales bacterium]